MIKINGRPALSATEALQAIKARLEGVYDDPALQKYGHCLTSTQT